METETRPLALVMGRGDDTSESSFEGHGANERVRRNTGCRCKQQNREIRWSKEDEDELRNSKGELGSS